MKKTHDTAAETEKRAKRLLCSYENGPEEEKTYKKSKEKRKREASITAPELTHPAVATSSAKKKKN